MPMFNHILFLNKKNRFLTVFILYFSILIIVFFTGGTKYSYPHLIYIPILLSALFFDLLGGLAGGIFSGIALAIMPLDTSTYQMQSLANGGIRLILLTNFGFITGLIFKYIIDQYNKLENIAYYDTITGLPNSILFKKRIDELLLNNQKFSVVSVSIENIVEIFNIIGHSNSELILKEITKFFQINEQNSNIKLYNSYSFRYDFIMTGFDYDETIKWLKTFDLSTQEMPVFIDKSHVFLNLVLGAYISEESPNNTNDIIRKTYLTLDYARKNSHNYEIYQKHMEDKFTTTVLITEVLASIKNKNFYLEYQPKLNLKDNKVYGVEALIRWNHPTLGKIPPSDFIPQLEKTNYINTLTYWILGEVINTIKELEKKGIDLKVSINMTPRSIQNKEFIDEMLSIIELNHINTISLELELTESDLMNELDSIDKVLLDLKNRGIKISIDDFGTGYSSLAYLKCLPIDIIKIDRSFIKDLLTDDNDKEIVNTTIKLGHALNKIIVAEGVEDVATLNLLKEMECDEIQGFYFARPMTKDKLEKFLK